jgi:hypothetical protein
VATSTYTEVSLREGAWINATTGAYKWIDDHARWAQRPGNAASLGVPDDVIEELGRIPWDFNGSGRKAIILLAMGQGLIRVRGHGSWTTFEFTIPWEQAIRGALRLMDETFGPAMTCRFNSLSSGQSLEFQFGRVRERLAQDDLRFLLPAWQRLQTHPPVPRPFLVADLTGKGAEWACWPLPGDLDTKGLIALIRGHVPAGGGWLALADGRTWKVTPATPPLLPVDNDEALSRFQICPDCGWPHAEPHAPCQCRPRTPCRLCQMPIFWPIPGYDTVHLDGTVLHVAHFVAYAHKCIAWPRVRVLGLQDLRGRS